MAAMTFSIDTSGVRFMRVPLEKMRAEVLNKVGANIIRDMTTRIHERGEMADGTQIGTYSPKYLQRRKKKHGDSTKIIFVMTDRLQGDWGMVDTDKGAGVGFKTPSVAKLVKDVFVNDPSYIYHGAFELSEDERKNAIEDMKIFYLEEQKKQ